MLCFWRYEPRKFRLLVRNNARSDSYGYAKIVSRGCVVRVEALIHAFADMCKHISVVLLCLVH